MLLRSLMMLSKAVAIGGVVSLTLIPDVLRVGRLIRILLDCPVGVSREEETVKGTSLTLTLVLVDHILLSHHRVVCRVRWLVNHGGKWLQIRSVVPLVRLKVRVI